LKTQLESTTVDMSGLVPSFGYTESDHYPYKNWLLYHVAEGKAEQITALPTGNE
jgi:hypothetical protein